MNTVISDEIIEKINYFVGKFSIIRDVAKLSLTCLENDTETDTEITSLLNMLSSTIKNFYDEYSDFIRQIEYPKAK